MSTIFISLLIAISFGQPVVASEASGPSAKEISIDEEFDSTPDAEAPKDQAPEPPAANRLHRWSVIVPTIVMHGELPEAGVSDFMPRRLDSSGRFVATPGAGIEFEGKSSLDLIAALIKDCYNDYAGTLLAGQYFKWGTRFRYGYTAGVYLRQTPITCYDWVTRTATPPKPGTGGRPGRINTVTTHECAFNDNLPIRYTLAVGNGYMDIIPSPFVNASVLVYKGIVDVTLKLMSNYYFNELGIAVPF